MLRFASASAGRRGAAGRDDMCVGPRPESQAAGTLGGVGSFKLTIRDGPKVTREKHDSLEAAIAALRSHTERIKAEGDLPEVSMIRTYEPGDQVRARLEVSTGGVLRSRDAGID